MIDYVKILLKGVDVPRLLSIDCLEFVSELSKKTGEISTKSVAKYHHCKITIYDSGIVLFTGSIHKLWNSINGIKANNYKGLKDYKGFNGNQFRMDDIIYVRDHLEKLFDCESNSMVFQNIELGVNTTPGFNPQLYLKGLLYHRGEIIETRYKRHYAEVEHQRYRLKIYNKSNQYSILEHTLRIELHIKKTEDIKCLGVKTFQDVNPETLDKAIKMLLKRFNEVVYYDITIDKKNLTRCEKELLKSYNRRSYWIDDLKPQHRDRHKKRLLKIIQSNSSYLHKKIEQNIIEKCVVINCVSKEAKCVVINTSSIGLNITHSLTKNMIPKAR